MGRNYTRKTDPELSDLAFIWDVAASDWRLTTLSAVMSLYQNNLTFPDAGRPEPNTQYSAPSATGFTILVTDNNEDTHLILTPAAAYADGAITLPASGTVRDKQIVIVNSTKQISTFVVNGNGATGVYGAPTSMGADDFFTLKYDQTVNSWYRIG